MMTERGHTVMLNSHEFPDWTEARGRRCCSFTVLPVHIVTGLVWSTD